MKQALVILGSAADVPREDLDGRTPLEVARMPEVSRLAAIGRVGVLEEPMGPGAGRPEVLLAGLMGCDWVSAQETCIGPLCAQGLPLPLEASSFVFVGQFVTLDGRVLQDGMTSRLSLDETEVLVREISPLWHKANFDLQVLRAGQVAVLCRDAGASFGPGLHPACREREEVDRTFPAGHRQAELDHLLGRTRDLLERHPVNEVRLDLGENPANALWLWGGGAPRHYRIAPGRMQGGALLSNSLWARGLGACLGMEVHPMQLGWPNDQDGSGGFRITPVVEALRRHDRLVMYVEPPLGGVRYGKTRSAKVRALEWLDRFVLEPLVSILEAYRPYRIVVASDAALPPAEGEAAPVLPVLLAGEEVSPDDASFWHESAVREGSLAQLAPDHVDLLFNEDWN